jgi:hypothetical protein
MPKASQKVARGRASLASTATGKAEKICTLKGGQQGGSLFDSSVQKPVFEPNSSLHQHLGQFLSE